VRNVVVSGNLYNSHLLPRDVAFAPNRQVTVFEGRPACDGARAACAGEALRFSTGIGSGAFAAAAEATADAVDGWSEGICVVGCQTVRHVIC